MKKMIYTLMCLAVIAAVAGCGSSKTGGRTANKQTGVEDVLQAGMAEADGTAQSDDESQGEIKDEMARAVTGADNGDGGNTEGVDVDLTSLSSTMVYSEVYSMMYRPEDYVGKTIKMDGQFAVYHDETTGNYYFACIIEDAAACCSQGIEFVLTEDYSYPEDYPKEGGEITVIGVFDTYMEDDFMYATLREAKIL